MVKIANNILNAKKWLMPENQIEPLINSYKLFVSEGKENSISKEDLEKGKDFSVNVKLISSSEDSESHEKTASNVEVFTSSGSSSGKVAVIDLHGTFFTRYDWFVYSYGGVGMDLIVSYLDILEKDASIDGVVLNIDSNGGSLAGTEALGKRISKFKKPIGAYVQNACHSAAYWVASQCDFILTESQTTYLGSIGVMMRHINRAEMYKNVGMEVSYLAAPQSTKKITAPDNQTISESDMDDLMSILRQDCAVFINAVKKGRGDKVQIDLVSNGEIFNSSNASRLGLHDGLAANGISDAVKRVSKLKNDAAKSAELNTNNKETMKFDNLKLNTANLALNQIGNKKRVIVETSKLVELDEKFKGVDLSGLEKKAVDGIQLDFSAIGISARKASLTNVIGLNAKQHCLVDCEDLAAINSMVEESGEESANEDLQDENLSEELEGDAGGDSEDLEESASEESNTADEGTEESEADEGSESSEDVLSESEEEDAPEASKGSDEVTAMSAKIDQLMAGMEALTSTVSELQENKKTLSTELENAKKAKEAAEDKVAKVVEKVKTVQKKFGTKLILEPEPSSEDGDKVSYNLGSTPDQKRANAVSIAKGILKTRDLNKKNAIYQKGREMNLGE